MFPALKRAFIPLALLAVLFGSATLPSAPQTEATVGDGIATNVWFLDSFGSPTTGCEDANLRDVRAFNQVTDTVNSTGTEPDPNVASDETVVQISISDNIILCVNPSNNAPGESNVVFHADGPGSWTDAACGDLAPNGDADGTFIERVNDDCDNEEGLNSNTMTVVETGNDLRIIAARFTCNSASVQRITIQQDDSNAGNGDTNFFTIMCKGEVNSISLTVSPDRIESSPALGNSSLSLIRAVITDASGGPVLPTTLIDITASGCSLSGIGTDPLTAADERDTAVELFDAFKKSPEQFFDDVDVFGTLFDLEGPAIKVPALEVDTNNPLDGLPNHSEALALLHAEGCEPGTITITVRYEGTIRDVEATATIAVVGPPAFLTITASPTTLVCGEKSEITVTATDKLNQVVSDHTFIEVVTNWGGVLGGTGSSLSNSGPVDPVSNTTITLLKGTGKAYLLTSDTHIGQYEVLAASTAAFFGRNVENHAPITAQVTVTCNKPATTVTAPNTGTGASTGTIRPPNTGDAGLAAAGDSSDSLFVIAGAVAFVLAAFAGLRFARR